VISAILSLAAWILLVALALRHLRAAGYAPHICAILVALFSLQLAAALSANTLHALLLALALFLMARAAMEFAVVQSARGVIALSLSLAAVQIASPAGLMVSAVVVPAFAASRGAPRGKNSGLLLLLLFTPLVSAVVFAYLAREFRFDPWMHTAGPFDRLLRPQIFDRMSPRRSGLINAVALVVVAFPIWWAASKSRRARVVAVIVSATVVAVAVAAWLQRSYPLGAFVPALSGLSLLAIAEIEDAPHRARQAIAIASASVIVSWLLLMVPL